MAKQKTNKAFSQAVDLSDEIIPVEPKKNNLTFIAPLDTPAPEGMKYCICEVTDGKKTRRDTFIFTEKEIAKLPRKKKTK